MSIQINLGELIDTIINVKVSTDQALSILEHNFRENIEAGAPKELVQRILIAIQETVAELDVLCKESF